MSEERETRLAGPVVVVCAVLVAVGAALAVFVPGMLWAGIILAVMAGWRGAAQVIRWRGVRTGGRVLEMCREALQKYTNAVLAPMAVTQVGGGILWHNPAFLELAGRPCAGWSIYRVFPQMRKPETDRKVTIKGRTFLRERISVELQGRTYVLHRLLDEGRSYQVSRLYETTMVTVAFILVDNYGEVMRKTPAIMQSSVEAGIEQAVQKWVAGLHGMVQKYEKNKYLAVFERKMLPIATKNRFDVLGEVRLAGAGPGAMIPTLSIGVGAGPGPRESDGYARQALELALGRGGDQAVVKEGENPFQFYGGERQGIETTSRVKVRLFAAALKNLMEQCETVFIMGHQTPDLDSMGAALGMLACARAVGDRAYIVLDQSNVSIEALVGEMRRSEQYRGALITPGEALALADEQSMAVVVDTLSRDLALAPQLVERVETVVVIDHHLRGTRAIENPTLLLHETFASSACEMVTEVVQYFAEDAILQPLEARALLAGMIIDTKGFAYSTGVRTFEAASYLRALGVDTAAVRYLFLDDLDTYNERAKIVQGAHMLPGGIAVATCRNGNASTLLAAQAADSLAQLKGVKASFVVCAQGNGVSISGRSFVGVNVQRILEGMGGGGHLASAGVQLKNTSVPRAVEMLEEAVRGYLAENK